MEEELKTVANAVYKCPNCGGNLTYEPSNESLKCAYCDYHCDLNGEISKEEEDFLEAQEEQDWVREVKTVECKNCGARNVLNLNDIVSNCPFCGSSSVLDTDELAGKRPNRVIPFKITIDNATDNYRKWLKKRFFAPRKVKKELPSPFISGVYIPSWTYDSNTFTNYTGRLGKYYTVTVGSGKNRRTETRIRWFYIKGMQQYTADDVLICSGKKVSQSNIDKISPFNTNDSYLYDQRYLSGFTAEHYTTNHKEAWTLAQKVITELIKKAILSNYSYDVVGNIDMKTNYTNIKYKYVLLPIWVCNYKYRNKTFNFVVNGESGKTTGKFPISPLKVIITVLLAMALIAVIVTMVIMYGE